MRPQFESITSLCTLMMYNQSDRFHRDIHFRRSVGGTTKQWFDYIKACEVDNVKSIARLRIYRERFGYASRIRVES